jgi:Ran GTPase-activating protein (RanGAP) involved in mRNA processing and transport
VSFHFFKYINVFAWTVLFVDQIAVDVFEIVFATNKKEVDASDEDADPTDDEDADADADANEDEDDEGDDADDVDDAANTSRHADMT